MAKKEIATKAQNHEIAQKKALEKPAINIDENDNPVLMLVKLKE